MEDLTQKYLSRPVDKRMVNLINKHIENYKSVLDIGCGSGLYGQYLKNKAERIIGIDYDPVLCKNAELLNTYDKVYCGDIKKLTYIISEKVDAIFCSEVLEHMSNEELPLIVNSMEEKSNYKIVITVPNPLSPHFKYDHSHILKYNIYSLLSELNKSKKFEYKLIPLGFSEQNLQKIVFRILNVISKRIALFSPTVAYIGYVK